MHTMHCILWLALVIFVRLMISEQQYQHSVGLEV